MSKKLKFKIFIKMWNREHLFKSWEDVMDDMVDSQCGVFDLGRMADKYYIHPDCHELLKPQVGDLVFNSEIYYIWEGMPLTKEFVPYHFLGVEGDDLSGSHRIVERNGKAFFMPEIEGVNNVSK